MTLTEYEDIQKGDALYFARIMPSFGYYEIHDVILVTKYDDHCSVCELKTKQSFLFNLKTLQEQLYVDREEALTYLKDMKKKNKDVRVYAKTKDVEAESEENE